MWDVKKKQNTVVLTDKFDNYNLSNANFCNFFDGIPQILRVKASIYIIYILTVVDIKKKVLNPGRAEYKSMIQFSPSTHNEHHSYVYAPHISIFVVKKAGHLNIKTTLRHAF